MQRNQILQRQNEVLQRENELHKEAYKNSGSDGVIMTKSINQILKDINRIDKPSVALVREALKLWCFHGIKFCSAEDLKSLLPNTIGWTVCKKLGIAEQRWPVFWGLRWVIAHNQFSKHKTETSFACKRVFEKSEYKFLFLIFAFSNANPLKKYFDSIKTKTRLVGV